MDYFEGIIKNTEFFTTSELAEKLKMNVQVITRKVQSGEISAYKIGKDWRIPEQAVYEWLEQHSNKKGKKASSKRKAVSSPEASPHHDVSSAVSSAPQPSEKLPTQSSKRKFLLEYILAQFEPNRLYSEEEVNKIIVRFHEDYETIRNEFLTEKMMERVDDKYRRRAGYRLSD